MDQTQIYIKTPAGELAMSERTRVVQRNLRMVLVMVDGRAVVADLVARIGNRTLVENALLELEEGGFISRVSKSQDEEGGASGTADPGSKPAPATRSGTPFPMPVPGARVRPVSTAKAWKPAPPSEPPLSRSRYAPASRPDLGRQTPAQRPVAATFDFSLSPAGMMPPPVTEIAAEVPAIPEYREGRGRKIGLALLGLLLALPLVALLFPYTAFFRDDLEKAMSLHLGVPVQFETVGIQILPRPGLVLNNVRIGIEGKTRIRRVLLPNGITPWHGPHPLLPEAVLEGMELDTEMLTRLPRLLAGNRQQNSPYRIAHLKLRDLALSAGSHTFSNGLGDVTFTPEGALDKIVLETSNLTLRAQLTPLPDSLPSLADPGQTAATAASAGRLSILIDGGGWPERTARPEGENSSSSKAAQAAGTGLQFDSLQANGILEAGKLTLERFSARLLEGQIKGQVLLGWSQQTAFSAALEANHIHAQGLARVFGSSFQAAGHLSGSLTLQGLARDWPELPAMVRGNGQFVLSQGALNGLNLVDAARRQPGQTVVGGSTRFEQMTGGFEISRNRLLLNNISLYAGLLQASGNLAIADNDHVDGQFTVTFGRFSGGRSQRARVYGPAGSMVAEAWHP